MAREVQVLLCWVRGQQMVVSVVGLHVQAVAVSWTVSVAGRYREEMCCGTHCVERGIHLPHQSGPYRCQHLQPTVGRTGGGGGDFTRDFAGILLPPLKSTKLQASMCLTKCLSIFDKLFFVSRSVYVNLPLLPLRQH